MKTKEEILNSLLIELKELDYNGWCIATDGSLEDEGDIDDQILCLAETIQSIKEEI